MSDSETQLVLLRMLLPLFVHCLPARNLVELCMLFCWLLSENSSRKSQTSTRLLKDSCWDGELLTVEQLKSLRCLEKAGKMIRLNSSTLLEGEGEKSSDSPCSRIKLLSLELDPLREQLWHSFLL